MRPSRCSGPTRERISVMKTSNAKIPGIITVSASAMHPERQHAVCQTWQQWHVETYLIKDQHLTDQIRKLNPACSIHPGGEKIAGDDPFRRVSGAGLPARRPLRGSAH